MLIVKLWNRKGSLLKNEVAFFSQTSKWDFDAVDDGPFPEGNVPRKPILYTMFSKRHSEPRIRRPFAKATPEVVAYKSFILSLFMLNKHYYLICLSFCLCVLNL